MDLSGHERDKLFLSRGAHDMVDVSYLSGADGLEDARTFAKADLDRDGFEDLVVVNRDAPLLRVYRNRIGPASKNHVLGLRVEGLREHDAVGTRITARGCGMTQTREIAIGAGFATTNSTTITLGLGTCTKLDELVVQFPNNGEKRTFRDVAADRFYRVVEGKGIQTVPNVYGRAATAQPASPAHIRNSSRLAQLAASASGHARFVLIDLFATWCEACVRTAPRLDALTSALATDFDVLGVTIEETDDAATVRSSSLRTTGRTSSSRTTRSSSAS